MISAEVDRELGDNAQRQANAISRASIVAATSGVFGFLQIQPGVPGESTVIGALSAGATISAIVAILLWNSRAVVMTDPVIASWLGLSTSALRERILMDKMIELGKARDDLSRKNEALKVALAFLSIAILIAVVVFIRDVGTEHG